MAITIGTKVAPVCSTKGNLTYGYVRELISDDAAYVYWPEIKSHGTWPLHALKAKSRFTA
jgi:hypothetical protein